MDDRVERQFGEPHAQRLSRGSHKKCALSDNQSKIRRPGRNGAHGTAQTTRVKRPQTFQGSHVPMPAFHKRVDVSGALINLGPEPDLVVEANKGKPSKSGIRCPPRKMKDKARGVKAVPRSSSCRVNRMSRINQLAQPRRRLTRKSLLDMMPVANVGQLMLSYLDPQSVLSVCMTCKELDSLASSNIVWLELWKHKYPKTEVRQAAKGDQIKQMFLYRRNKLIAKGKERIKKIVNDLSRRVGVDNSLSLILEKLELDISVEINNELADLVAFRRKSQQGSKLGFRVHSACPAPNLAAGALKFDMSTVLKVATPGILLLRDLKSIRVRSKWKNNKRRGTEILDCNCSTANLESFVYEQQRVECFPIVHNRSSLFVGVHSEDSSIAFIVINLHHVDVLSGLGIGERTHVPILDDLDPNYGFHGYTCSVSLRSFGQSWWVCNRRDVHAARIASANPSVVRFLLLSPEGCDADVTRHVSIKGRGREEFLQNPELYIRTESFSMLLEQVGVADFCMWDEHGKPFWGFTRVLQAQALEHTDQSFRFEDGGTSSAFTLRYSEMGTGTFTIECSFLQDTLVVKRCYVEIQRSRINYWFGKE
uniref:F-box domain-containing protein n=1 Tax=Mucochytrium quahogii TaxID=96639 RepID=A0A7S2SN38_9STRA|mmetsp:Transcript_21309/g.34669  ORF Transcript_21309/g.34669 Transcript_21309/m.34669 type:complete len:593 (+) Transcript_21309:1098-2876(+)